MTNKQYQRSRGLDKPFEATEKQIKQAWFEMNKDAILKRRRREKKFGKQKPFMGPIDEVFS